MKRKKPSDLRIWLRVFHLTLTQAGAYCLRAADGVERSIRWAPEVDAAEIVALYANLALELKQGVIAHWGPSGLRSSADHLAGELTGIADFFVASQSKIDATLISWAGKAKIYAALASQVTTILADGGQVGVESEE